MFGFLKKVVKGTVDTALIPVATTVDILDGDLDLPRTSNKIEDVGEDLEDLLDTDDD